MFVAPQGERLTPPLATRRPTLRACLRATQGASHRLGALLVAAALAACNPGGGAAGAAASAASGASAVLPAASGASAPGAAASAPPVSVTLVRAAARDFTLTLEASGTVTAQSSVDVKPQVSAQVLAVHVKEGQFVQRGQPLFTLDARIDQANLKKAEAQSLKDEATLADARRQLARSQDLLGKNFISQGAVDTSQANVDAQQAVVAADKAAIDALKAQLTYSRINAAGAGRVGPIAVFPGSSVSPTGPALLTITQIDPVAVAFNLPQRNLPDALKALASGNGVVSATLPDMAASGAGSGQRQGKLSFVDSTVDAASGTVKVKAVFSNKDQALWPGAYVSVKMALQTLPDAIVVPLAAIVQGARGTAVFVAGPGNVAAIRPVKVLTSAGTEAVVSGLKPGERIVLDGRQNVRPGTPLIERAAEAGRGASGARGGPGAAVSASGASAGAAPAGSSGASGGTRAP
jgi:RND family efflux transporter MFP subunit